MLLLWLGACQGPFSEDVVDGVRHLSAQISSNPSGTARVRVSVEEGEQAMLSTASVAPPNKVHFRSLYGPHDTEAFLSAEWSGSIYSKTNGGFIATTTTLNWPVLASDVPLSPGRWIFELGVVDEAQRYIGQPVDFELLLKEDPELDGGSLEVALIFADDLDRDEALAGAVDGAKAIWQALYAQVGIEVSFESYAYDGAPLAPPAFGGEPGYVGIAAETPIRSINLVFSEEIDGYSDILGISGDIPGPLVPSARSAVQLSTLLAAGPDGIYDAEDVRLLAETMAHETAHFLGLFHPVEREGWSEYDVLQDTDECDREPQCIQRLGRNLMFPFPVCGIMTCTPQDELTVEQGEILNRYTGVR
ncbi:MAG TPA: hypothetical protein ENK18_03680 [Deltaproteobacteria bacterium]|nr:hypothetical protein [Deltaproteobacteria bacterium]